jgi:hypothetical protein
MNLDVMSLIVAIAAVGGVTIALLQLRASQRDARAARAADLSWQIYQQYDGQEIRDARRAIEVVSHHEPVPKTAEEYGLRYALQIPRELSTHEFSLNAPENYGAHVRRMLRFYHQVGILMDNRLIDPDFVFQLLGAGLDTSRHGISVATGWYQNYLTTEWKGDLSGESPEFPKLAKPRNIYDHALSLCDEYDSWKAKQPERITS